MRETRKDSVQKLRSALALLTAMLTCLLFGCAADGYAVPEEGMLFDFYTAPAATAGEAIYREITIEKAADDYFLHVYSGDRSRGTTTSHESYKTTPSALTDVMDIVQKRGMKRWNGKQGISLTGSVTVVKFYDAGGNVIRVSTEHMPEDGELAFSMIAGILDEYLSMARNAK